MQKTPVAREQHTHAGTSTLVVGLSILLALSSIVLFTLSRHPIHDFQFNFYALLSFLPLTVNVWLVVLIMRLRVQSEETVWFVLYLCGLSIACLGEGLQRMSVQVDGAIFWYHLNSIGFAIMPIAYYLFALSYVKPLRSQSALLLPILFTSATIIIFFFSSTDLFFSLQPQDWFKEPWGYNAPTNTAFLLLLAWIEIPLIMALITLVRFSKQASNELLRRQSRVYIWAILVPLVGGTITDGILPFLGFNSIVPASLFLSSCTSVIAYIGLKKYRSFQVNPAGFAQDVIYSMHEAVIVTDTNYKINFMNREAERLFATKVNELTGKQIGDQFSPESWEVIRRYHQQRGGSAITENVDELTVVNQSAEKIPVSVYTSRLDEDSPNEAYIFIIADISDLTASYHQLEASAARIRSQNEELQENQETMERLLHQAEDLQKQLRHEKENVEHTVEVRTAELREARDKLKESDQLKSEFIMLSSHNLRTPLAIMSSSVEMLAGNDGNLSPEQKAMVEALEKGTDRLGEFVEDLLTIATLEAGDGMDLVPTEVSEVIEPLLGEAASMAAAKGLAFEKDIAVDGVQVRANTLRLRGALRNILHNALNYTQSGNIGLRIHASDESVHIEIWDTGMGIAPDELPNVFTKFHRATSTLKYNYQGIGIGLYLTKLVIEEHHGHISVASELGAGSTFTIELPRFNA